MTVYLSLFLVLLYVILNAGTKLEYARVAGHKSTAAQYSSLPGLGGVRDISSVRRL